MTTKRSKRLAISALFGFMAGEGLFMLVDGFLLGAMFIPLAVMIFMLGTQRLDNLITNQITP